MSNGILLSDWITEDEFNYSPTGELAEAIELAMMRRSVVKFALDYDWTNGTSETIEEVFDNVLSWGVENDLIKELIKKVSDNIK